MNLKMSTIFEFENAINYGSCCYIINSILNIAIVDQESIQV